jgi:hypothetical protein
VSQWSEKLMNDSKPLPPAELAAIRERDARDTRADSGRGQDKIWQASRDRRALLQHIDALEQAIRDALEWKHLPDCNCSRDLNNRCREQILRNALRLTRGPGEAAAEPCADCDAAKRHAYSDATTPGFFFTECEKHRRPQS